MCYYINKTFLWQIVFSSAPTGHYPQVFLARAVIDHGGCSYGKTVDKTACQSGVATIRFSIPEWPKCLSGESLSPLRESTVREKPRKSRCSIGH
jgi:hypothetical protein